MSDNAAPTIRILLHGIAHYICILQMSDTEDNVLDEEQEGEEPLEEANEEGEIGDEEGEEKGEEKEEEEEPEKEEVMRKYNKSLL